MAQLSIAAAGSATAATQFSLAANSPRRTFAAGQPLGPDFDLLAAMRTNVLAGIVS